MMTTTADAARRRVRLAPSALTTAVLLLPGPLPGRLGSTVADELAALEAAGIVRRRRLVGWVAELTTPVLAAELHITVQQALGPAHSRTEIWVGASGASLGEVDDDRAITLSSTDPAMLGWTLAALVGLGERPEPMAPRVRLATARLAEFDELIASGDRLAAAERLVDGVEEACVEDLATLLALGSNERRAWRVTASWTDTSNAVVVRSLSVLDAGIGGLWLADEPSPTTEADAPAEPPPAVHLMPVTTADVLAALFDLLPPGFADSPLSAPRPPGRASCPPPSLPTPPTSSASWRTPVRSTSA